MRESHCHCVCAFVTCPQIHLNKLFHCYRSGVRADLMGEKGDILAQHAHIDTLGNKTQWDIEAKCWGGINHCLLWEAIKIGIEYITWQCAPKALYHWSCFGAPTMRIRGGGFRLCSTLSELANKWCPKRDNYIPRARRQKLSEADAHPSRSAEPRQTERKTFWRAKFLVCVHCVWQRIISLSAGCSAPAPERNSSPWATLASEREKASHC